MIDDTALIRRVLDGETDAFRVLVSRHQDALFGLVGNLLPDRHGCEDVAQEALLAAYAKLDRFDNSRASFRTWLLTIARNKCFHWLEKRKPITLAELPERSSPAKSGDNEREDFFRQLDAALERLPFEQKTAFVLAELQGLPYEEIAAIEQVKLGTVKSRIARAKAKLREIFPRHLVEDK